MLLETPSIRGMRIDPIAGTVTAGGPQSDGMDGSRFVWQHVHQIQRGESFMSRIRIAALTLCLAAAFSGPAVAQAKNNVPEVVPGARPATVERIKVHGASLEGNLEGDAVDRNVLVFLPPSYAAERTRLAGRRQQESQGRDGHEGIHPR